jgi:hypothetical protein
MYWYNPTTRTSERVEAPSTDEQAIQMLAGTQESAQLIKEYCKLRYSRERIDLSSLPHTVMTTFPWTCPSPT